MSVTAVPTVQPKPMSADQPNIAYANFGCYITVVNKLTSNLILKSKFADDGHWNPDPLETITAGATVILHLSDPSGPTGSKGGFEYTIHESGRADAVLSSKFDCPYGSGNDFWAGITGDGASAFKVDRAPYSDGGHPFSITITVGYN